MLITIKTACEYSGASDKTIRNWIDEGKIKKFEDESGKTLIDKKELLLQLPTVITMFNQKGGCGKTTSSILMADYFEKQNYKILIVDLDQQGNISQSFFQFDNLSNSPSLYNHFENKTPLHKIIKKYSENIDLLPADIQLARKDNIDTSLLIQMKDEFQQIFKKYNIVILDCPPSLNALSRLGVLLSNYIFCPVLPEPFSYKGLSELLNSIKVLSPLNRDFIDYRVFISSHKKSRAIIREDYITQFREELKDKILESTIPDFIGIVERGVAFKNIFDMYSESDKSIIQIKELMNEFEKIIFEDR